jgi:putative sterol carrier protein
MSGYTDVEQFSKVVEAWIEKLKNDDEVAKRCQGINCTMGFEIYDPDLQFHMEFQDGDVTGGLGEADPPSQVFLEMSSETLDGMMTGEIDGASAAMSGQMSISGDMSAAMGLQALSDDMNRLYVEAKDELVSA